MSVQESRCTDCAMIECNKRLCKTLAFQLPSCPSVVSSPPPPHAVLRLTPPSAPTAPLPHALQALQHVELALPLPAVLPAVLPPMPLPGPSAGNPLQCNTCGVVLSSASNLKRHFMTHTGERPYRCQVCGVTYTQSNNLKRHYMFTHGQQSAATASAQGMQGPMRSLGPLAQ